MKRKIFINLLITIISVFLIKSGYALENNFLHPARYVMENGINVLIQEEHHHPITSIQICVRTGSRNENSQTNGISHLCEHLFFRHTNPMTSAPFKASLERLGAEFNAETSKDYTCYYVNLPSKNTAQALRLMADAYINYSFSQEDFENEKKIVLNEYGLNKDNPMAKLIAKLDDVAFPNHPYRYQIIGTEHGIKDFSLNDAVNYKERNYTPSNTSIIVVGDVNTYDVMENIKTFFGSFKGPGQEDIPASESIIPYTNQEIVEEADVTKYYILLGYKTPGIKNIEDIYAIDIITFLAGQGKSSMLHDVLTKDNKLAEEVFASFVTPKDPGLFYIAAICKHDKYEEAKKGIFEVIENLKNGNFSDKEFERARNLLISTYVFGAETNLDKAKTLGFYEAIDSYKIACGYIDGINSTTKADVVKEANKLFGNSYYLLVFKPKYIPKEDDGKTKPPFPFNIFNW
ncbi:MAG: pitrilysin family protein [Armatimonadota bacterium]